MLYHVLKTNWAPIWWRMILRVKLSPGYNGCTQFKTYHTCAEVARWTNPCLYRTNERQGFWKQNEQKSGIQSFKQRSKIFGVFLACNSLFFLSWPEYSDSPKILPGSKPSRSPIPKVLVCKKQRTNGPKFKHKPKVGHIPQNTGHGSHERTWTQPWSGRMAIAHTWYVLAKHIQARVQVRPHISESQTTGCEFHEHIYRTWTQPWSRRAAIGQ